MFRFLLPLAFVLAACGGPTIAPETTPAFQAASAPVLYPGETPEMRRLVNKWADYYNIPRSLLHRVIQRESDYRAGARNGPYWGIMQILPATARNMGMVGGPEQLLDGDIGLKYSARYLRGAWMLSGGSEDVAVSWYAKGYYYEARDRGLLQETGLRGNLWQRYDAGEAKMPRIDEKGRLLPQVAEVECVSPTGIGRLLREDTCS
ncbi:lytic transglycosylase domain-containing protein [Jannaschia pohangensis]|uniref:Transglycosylase SLT domain-containing protein n=1 Tax=Jannaschia pohangensis TaxID=390807 RepID=A0A1I3TB67_9RHOB|nr:Transglycosylase SLT domain-containing protein [Jannaschia pohangensis]